MSSYLGHGLREEAARMNGEYLALIAQMKGGTMLASAPWGDKRFQEVVNRALAQSGEAEKIGAEFDIFKRHLRDVIGPKT